MVAIDFVTALGRVLHDGALRDAFAADPAAFVGSLGLEGQDRAMFLRLAPADLEFQARVLLRKRFVLVRDLLPATCENLGADAWPEFARYGRVAAHGGKTQTAEDAFGFSRHLLAHRSQALCPAELNRCRFVQERRRAAFHIARPLDHAKRPALQVLCRIGRRRWREWTIYFAV